MASVGQPDAVPAGRRIPRADYRGVVLACPVTVQYKRYSVDAAQWWLGAALRALVEASGVSHRAIDGFAFTSFTAAPDKAIGLTQHFGISPRWLDDVPLGGAAAVVSIRRAARAVQCGDADIVACIAGDTNHVDTFRQTLAGFSRFAQDAVFPYGAGGANMSFAFITRSYMHATGASREDFGKLCVAQRDYARANPRALMRRPLTLDDYLGARPIAEPITLYDCVMPCAGADGFLVMREDEACRLELPFVRLVASIERHNAFPDDAVQTRGGWLVDADDLYAMAGSGPDDVDLVETYDDYPVISMLQFEGLGLCPPGEGPSFVRQNTFGPGGTVAHNTGGGQLSVGQAGAAGGHLGIVEAMRQLLGCASGIQVEKARRALVSGFGMINFDRGLSSGAVILEAA